MVIIIGKILVFLGIFLVFSATLGCIKLPDYFTKMHAATIGDAIGCPIVLFGIAMQNNDIISALKIILLACILLIINPTASYILNNIALKQNLPLELERDNKDV